MSEHVGQVDAGRQLSVLPARSRAEGQLPLTFFAVFVAALLVTIALAMLAATHSF